MSSASPLPSPREERADALIADWLEASEQGQAPDPQEYISRHPEFAVELHEFFADQNRFRNVVDQVLESPLESPLESRLQAARQYRAPAEAGTPTAGTPTSPTAIFGVHELLHEIARGGMGVVFKGRDTVIGRDIAVKVLQERHQGEADLLARFVEEAQIAGQLQHPGIAPVYELGEFPDRRPYFTMKLVKGETLAKLLADRSHPTRDRPHLLKICEQVCQTLAYAHSRGVIHRDLKPANIMVGAFGEVQVMDWGLAKVLPVADGVPDGAADGATTVASPAASVIRTQRSDGARDAGGSSSQTQAGSILGTLAYMPPEQALGESRHLDQRADVFALGAILCEILTGRPPYTGTSFEQLRRQAIRADLTDAFDRLDRCGADAELIGLARRAPAAEPADRPADAGVLARALTVHFESVEARLRQAELAEVQARTRAIAERHRRRLTLAFAGVVLAVLAVGVIGTTWGLLAEREARRTLRRELFVADLELAGQTWDSEDGTARNVADLLAGHVPRHGETDLRDFAWRLQWTALHRNARVLKGHDDGARLAAFAPDGELVTLDGDLTLRRWNLAADTNAPGENLPMVPHVSSWAMSADARFIALGAGDTVHVFDARTGAMLHTMTQPALVLGLGFSPDGGQLVAVWGEGGAVVWDSETGMESTPFQFQPTDDLYHVQSVGLAPDGESLFLLGFPKGTQMTRLRVGDAAPPDAHDYPSTVYSLALTTDGLRGATGDANGQVYLSNAATDENEGEPLKVHHGVVSALAFSSDGTRLATGGDDGVVTVWDVIPSPPRQIALCKGHRGRIRALVFAPDCRRLASASDDGSARAWDLPLTVPSRVFGPRDLPVFSLAFSADGRRLAIGTGSGDDPPGGIVEVWEVPSARLVSEFLAAEGRVLGLAFTAADGRALATGGYDSKLRLWDVASSRELRDPLPGQITDPPDPSRQAIGTLAISPDGKFVAAGFGIPTYHHPDYDQVAKVWDLATRRELPPLSGHSNNIPSVAFSRDGKLLATAGDDHQVKLWSTRNWKNVGKPLVGRERFKSVVFSPDGRAVVTGSNSGTITFWEIEGGLPLRQLHGHANAVQGLAFSPDGRTLASASWDNTVKLWEPISGRETRTLRDHDDWISCLAFSPDGNTLATGSFDKSVRLWEAATLEEIAAAAAEDRALTERSEARHRSRQEARRVRKAISLDATALDRYTGNYGRGLTVRREDEHLTIQPISGAQGHPVAIYPQSEKEFFCRDRDRDIAVTFLHDDSGRVIRLLVHQTGRSFSARKLSESEQ